MNFKSLKKEIEEDIRKWKDHPCLFCFGLVFQDRVSLYVALEPVLELALVDQVGLELTEIHLPLLPECWN